MYIKQFFYLLILAICTSSPSYTRTWEQLGDCKTCNQDEWAQLKSENYGCIRCNLEGADFSDLQWTGKRGGIDFDIRGSSLKGASFKNAVIKDAFNAMYATKESGLASAARSTVKAIKVGGQTVTMALNDVPGLVESGIQAIASGKCPDINIACYVGSKEDRTFCGATRISQDFTTVPGDVLPKCHVNNNRALEACKKMCAYDPIFNTPDILSTVSFDITSEQNLISGLGKIATSGFNCPEIPIECYAGFEIPAQPATNGQPAQEAQHRQSCGSTSIGSSWKGTGCVSNFDSAKQRCDALCMQSDWGVPSSSFRVK